MSKHSRTGVRGLYRLRGGRYRIDLRWREPGSGESRRHTELLPPDLPAVAAKRRAREMLAAALAGNWDPRGQAPLSLKEAFKEYDAWCKSNRPNGLAKRQAAVSRLLDVMGDCSLDRLSPLGIERFKRVRLDDGVKPATVNRDLEVLSHFLGLATSWGWITDSRARELRGVPHLKEPPGRVRYLTAAEEQHLFDCLPTRVLPVVAAALLSGMREAEVAKLRKGAVDLSAYEITLTRTKNNKVRRIPINEALAAVLRAAMGQSTGDYVFTSRRGKPYTTDGIRSIFRRAVIKAQIEDFHFHDLRHSFATALRRRGVGIDVIAELLGHSSLAMAQRYAHIGRDLLREAVSKLPPPPKPSADAAPLPQTRKKGAKKRR